MLYSRYQGPEGNSPVTVVEAMCYAFIFRVCCTVPVCANSHVLYANCKPNYGCQFCGSGCAHALHKAAANSFKVAWIPLQECKKASAVLEALKHVSAAILTNYQCAACPSNALLPAFVASGWPQGFWPSLER